MKFIYKQFKNQLTNTFNGLVEKEIKVDDDIINIFFYVISYTDLFTNEIKKNMRGITFVNKDKYYLSIHKFFNLNQVEETDIETLRNKQIIEITDKLDGSMINPIKVNNKIIMKSNGSIESIQSKNATEFVYNNKTYLQFINYCIDNNLHPIFEWISPYNKIVLNYENDDLVLLQIRDNNGNYLNIKDFDIPTEITVRKEYDLNKFNNIDDVYMYIKDKINIEGVVVRFADGTFVKVKSDWYFDKHKYTDLNEKVIMEKILKDEIDDILQNIDNKDIIYSYINKVSEYIKQIINYVIAFDYSMYKTKKELAIKNSTNIYFKYMMLYYNNTDIEHLTKIIKQHMLKTYNKVNKCIDFFNK